MFFLNADVTFAVYHPNDQPYALPVKIAFTNVYVRSKSTCLVANRSGFISLVCKISN